MMPAVASDRSDDNGHAIVTTPREYFDVAANDVNLTDELIVNPSAVSRYLFDGRHVRGNIRRPFLGSIEGSCPKAIAILYQAGGWFGWSGLGETSPEPIVFETEGVAYATVNLTRADHETWYSAPRRPQAAMRIE
jgi:hypothetical protein